MRRCLSSIIIITLLFNVLSNLIYSVKAELLMIILFFVMRYSTRRYV